MAQSGVHRRARCGFEGCFSSHLYQMETCMGEEVFFPSVRLISPTWSYIVCDCDAETCQPEGRRTLRGMVAGKGGMLRVG
ncbi:hypothetical protein E2C01_044680 [Portunus trituberculatus]|uniref:Uncharacterized protein n=1 Tax=Portunus trituberculatus TaxID=210409 RepID=A0A5B7FZ05_PORTR|nr:hypothetical protein [Portunus trituberculatus]